MSKVIWHTTMSLDGFIAGPGDSMDWAWERSSPNELANEDRDATGAILGGRRWHNVAMEKYDGRHLRRQVGGTRLRAHPRATRGPA